MVEGSVGLVEVGARVDESGLKQFCLRPATAFHEHRSHFAIVCFWQNLPLVCLGCLPQGIQQP